MTDVVVVGDVMLDVVAESAALAAGGDVHGRVRVHPGGGAANAAVWAAAAGASVALYGRVGDDVPGRMIRDAVAERGVEPHLAADPEEPTGTMLVIVEDGERSMVADRGANARLSPDDLPGVLEAGAVLVSGYILFHPGSEAAALAALERARAEHVAVDAASWPLVEAYGVDRFFHSTAGATILLANEREAGVLAGGPEFAALAERYAVVCVKRGRHGAMVLEGGRATRVGSSTAAGPEALDTTGAGDAFDGAFLAALARGASPAEAAFAGCEAGSRRVASGSRWPGR
ncbi:MAG: PfkB family carbohydrate kinase [Actinomycetota bacterium]|nr:PfkB family carbohydrate kinase [Actinomycetota bacterium]